HSLMNKCWQMEQKQRPSFHELTERLKILQKNLELQVERARKYVNGSLSVLAEDYTQWDDYKVTLFEDLILCNIEKPLPQSRLMAVQYAGAIFPSNHAASKYVLLRGAGDAVKIVQNEALDILREQTKKDGEEKENLFPEFSQLVNFVSVRAGEKLTDATIKSKGPLGTFHIPFTPAAYEKITIYLRMCLAYESGTNPHVIHPEQMNQQGPVLSKRINQLLDDNDGSLSEGPIPLYFGMLRQYIAAVGGSATMYRMLELVAAAPERLAPQFFDKLDQLKVLVSSENADMRMYAAELYAIVLSLMDKQVLLTSIQTLTHDLDNQNLEVQHGSELALGFVIGRYLQKRGRLASHENIEHMIGDSSNEDIIFTEAVKAIVVKLDSVIVMLVEGACLALGEIGRNGPLPLLNGIDNISRSKQIQQDEDPQGNEVEEITKLHVIQILMSKVLSEDDVIQVKERAAMSLAYQTVGDPHFSYRNIIIQGFLDSTDIHVQPRTEHIALHFAIGEALATTLQGPNSAYAGDIWRTAVEDRGSLEPISDDIDWLMNALVEKYIQAVPEEQIKGYGDYEGEMDPSYLAVCIWLLILVEHFRTHPAIVSRLQAIQETVTSMMSHWEETGVTSQLSPLVQSRMVSALQLMKPTVSVMKREKMITVRLTAERHYHSEVKIQINRRTSSTRKGVTSTQQEHALQDSAALQQVEEMAQIATEEMPLQDMPSSASSSPSLSDEDNNSKTTHF
ncbi:proteasome adapter and scaffold protein ECM29-like, partial [Saccoglossus kowalevskii]|uniref:Proteasome-associated protein ECM29 homolog n=1 Tax=Saccoglossus kowalevskii TaxID=10224 RepID=A0ABM0MJ94_SACKO